MLVYNLANTLTSILYILYLSAHNGMLLYAEMCFHWLPVYFRVEFNICLLTYKTLREKQPVYFHSKLATSLPARCLRSSTGITLSFPRVKTNAGAMTFHPCAPFLPTICPFSHLNCNFQEMTQNISL